MYTFQEKKKKCQSLHFPKINKTDYGLELPTWKPTEIHLCGSAGLHVLLTLQHLTIVKSYLLLRRSKSKVLPSELTDIRQLGGDTFCLSAGFEKEERDTAEEEKWKSGG